MDKSCLPFSNFFPYKPSYHLQYLNRYAIDLKLGSSAYFFPALFISGILKVPGLKFKGGYVTRSCKGPIEMKLLSTGN